MIKLELPELQYSKDSLEPFMSAETIELHHDKHHLAYVTNGNKFIEEQSLKEENINDLIINAYKNSNAPVFNNEVALVEFLVELLPRLFVGL